MVRYPVCSRALRLFALRFIPLTSLVALAAFTGTAMAQSPASNAAPNAQTNTQAGPDTSVSASSIAPPEDPAAIAVMGKLPPLPTGRSTVIGGRIVSLNPVLDRFTLKVFGGRTMKILFDERTQVFRNGVRIPVLDLRRNEHASVETTLDGSRVFALRIHMLTHLPQGQCEGQVVSYDARSGQLTVNAALSQQPIVLHVPPGTPVVRVGEKTFTAGQQGASDLAPGSLVRVTFTSSETGYGVATHVDVLATSGSQFIFGGVLKFLDVPDGQMTIVDPRDNHRYQIAFNPAQFPVSHRLRLGAHVRVAAKFNGTQYMATSITLE